MRCRARWWLFVVALEIAALSVASAATPKTNAKTDPNADWARPLSPTPDRPIGLARRLGQLSGRDAADHLGLPRQRRRRHHEEHPLAGLAPQHRRFQPDHRRRPDLHHLRSGRPGVPRQENGPRHSGFARIPSLKGSTQRELKSEPAYAEKLAPLSRQLAAVNDTLVQALNSGLPPTAPQCVAVINQRKTSRSRFTTSSSISTKKGYTPGWAQSRVRLQRTDAHQRQRARLRKFFTTGVSVLLRPARQSPMDSPRRKGAAVSMATSPARC